MAILSHGNIRLGTRHKQTDLEHSLHDVDGTEYKIEVLEHLQSSLVGDGEFSDRADPVYQDHPK